MSKYPEVSTAQLSALLDKPDDSAKDAKIPTFVQPKSEYTDYLSKHCRSAYNASKVLSNLIYHAQRNKPGDNSARLAVIREGGRWKQPAYWWLHTRKEIAAECQMTEDQARQALKTLDRLGLIEALQGRHPINGVVRKYRGKTVLHIRLAACIRGCGLTEWPTVDQLAQTRIILDGDKSPMINGDKSPALVPDALEGGDALEESINSANEQPFAGETIPESPKAIPGENQIQNQDQTPTPTPGVVKKNPGASAKKSHASPEFLSAWSAQKAAYAAVAVNDDHPGPCLSAEIEADEASILQRIEYRTCEAGFSATAFIRWLTPARWQGVAMSIDPVGYDARLNARYLLKHLGVFLAACGTEYQQQKAKAAEAAAKKVKPMAAPAPKTSAPMKVSKFLAAALANKAAEAASQPATPMPSTGADDHSDKFVMPVKAAIDWTPEHPIEVPEDIGEYIPTEHGSEASEAVGTSFDPAECDYQEYLSAMKHATALGLPC